MRYDAFLKMQKFEKPEKSFFEKKGRPKRKWTDADDDALSRLAKHGVPVVRIAADLERTPAAITQRGKILGIRLTHRARQKMGEE